jgi:hypothetical protein
MFFDFYRLLMVHIIFYNLLILYKHNLYYKTKLFLIMKIKKYHILNF